MSHDHAPPSRWRTRILWAALGSLVTALVTALVQREPEPPPLLVTTSGSETGEPLATAGPGSTSTQRGGGPPEPSVAAQADATAAGGSTSGSRSEVDATSGLEISLDELPEIPLPRMPGTRFMRRFRQPEGQGWLITLGLSVPAPGAQVEAFYRSALREQGLQILSANAGGSASPMREGHRSTLKARRKHASVEITIHQRANTLRSVVRIYWRTKVWPGVRAEETAMSPSDDRPSDDEPERR